MSDADLQPWPQKSLSFVEWCNRLLSKLKRLRIRGYGIQVKSLANSQSLALIEAKPFYGILAGPTGSGSNPYTIEAEIDPVTGATTQILGNITAIEINNQTGLSGRNEWFMPGINGDYRFYDSFNSPPTCPPFFLSGIVKDVCTGNYIGGLTITATAAGQDPVVTHSFGTGVGMPPTAIGTYYMPLPVAGPWTVTLSAGTSGVLNYPTASFTVDFTGLDRTCSIKKDFLIVSTSMPDTIFQVWGCMAPESHTTVIPPFGDYYVPAVVTITGPNVSPIPGVTPVTRSLTCGHDIQYFWSGCNFGKLIPGSYTFTITADRFQTVSGTFIVSCYSVGSWVVHGADAPWFGDGTGGETQQPQIGDNSSYYGPGSVQPIYLKAGTCEGYYGDTHCYCSVEPIACSLNLTVGGDSIVMPYYPKAPPGFSSACDESYVGFIIKDCAKVIHVTVNTDPDTRGTTPYLYGGAGPGATKLRAIFTSGGGLQIQGFYVLGGSFDRGPGNTRGPCPFLLDVDSVERLYLDCPPHTTPLPDDSIAGAARTCLATIDFTDEQCGPPFLYAGQVTMPPFGVFGIGDEFDSSWCSLAGNDISPGDIYDLVAMTLTE